MGRLVPIAVAFWASNNGREPVRAFLKDQPKADRLRLGEDLRKLQFGWPIGMPPVRPLGDGLFELRSALPSRREVRIIFVAAGRQLVLLHGFVKKTQKTPADELRIAKERRKELLS
jgi:phage-related protein